MLSPFNIPNWSQRDPQWAGQRLGTQGSATTIGQSGCLITCISMMNAAFNPSADSLPNHIDDLFSDNNGYANANLVIWNAINRILPDCSTQGEINCINSPAPIADIKAHLDVNHLAILQVGFGGNPNNMHFVLACGYDGDDIIFMDPWWGDRNRFASKRYGSGNAATDILFVHYFADGSPEPVKPSTPVAPRPVEQPMLGYQREVRAGVNVNYRTAPNSNADKIKLFKTGDILDFKGFVHGEVVDNLSDIWFVGRYSNGFAFSKAFTDADTHDLPDLTNELFPPAPAPAPDPQPEPAPTPEATEVIPEYERTWLEDDSFPQMVVAVPSADVINAATGEVVKKLPGGEAVQKLAGYFRINNEEYVRTQWSVDNNTWYGIKLSDIKEYQAPKPPVNPNAPVDAIQPPPSPFNDLNIFDDLEEPEAPRPSPNPQSTEVVIGAWRHFIEVAWSIVLVPLRYIGPLFNKNKEKK